MINLPRLSFAHLPTRIEALERLTQFLNGPRLLVKRDDQTGLAFGGNKTRKLELLLADALKNGARTLVTAGAIQSNHCRQTAAAAARYGFESILVLTGEPSLTPSGNLLLDQLFGAEIVWDTTQRIEVLRGPFFALYGNHSGGVVQLFTEEGPPQPTLSARAWAGSWDTWKAGVTFGGAAGGLNYIGNLSRFDTGGYRDHSAARKDQFTGKLGSTFAGGSTLSFVVNYLDQPDNEDPLGLTAVQVAQNPQQAGTNAVAFDTRRSLNNLQGGLVYEVPFTDEDTLRAMLSVGNRTNDGYLAILPGTQNGVRNSGLPAGKRQGNTLPHLYLHFRSQEPWNHRAQLSQGGIVPGYQKLHPYQNPGDEPARSY